jgi:NAD(P)-dependent dehydrogenase (short-subunit alcohol dehydrogenase family)
MAGRVTVIVGLGTDIGIAIARSCLEAGESVLVADTSEKRVAAAEGALEGPVVVRHEAEFSQIGISNCLKAAVEAYGRVDHLVHIPPIPRRDTLASVEIDRLAERMSALTVSATTTLRLFSEVMAEQEPFDDGTIRRLPQRGAFTFVLSLTSLLADHWRFSETVLQNAVIGVMRAGAVSLAPQRIRVNAIAAIRPRAERRGLVASEDRGSDSEGVEAAEFEVEADWLKLRTPMGRAALADEIAQTVRFLNSDDAGFITGEVLRLDGGRGVLNGVIST